MVLRSYAKINLTLKVNSKRQDKLHEIQSFFCLISLKDKIVLKKVKQQRDKIIFKGPFANFVNKSNNSVINLFKILRRHKLISGYYSVTVFKNIPVFAGLGGGTGNAASILKYFLKKNISGALLKEVETKIGTDFKLFFHKQGFLKNLGSIINFEKKQKLFFLLVQPGVKCSTKEIYLKVKNYSKKRILKKNKINTKLKLLNYLSKDNNDLQSIVEKKYPIFSELLENIKNEKGCYFSRITGSGSVCYGLFKERNDAKKALNNLKVKYPKFWTSLAKTV